MCPLRCVLNRRGPSTPPPLLVLRPTTFNHRGFPDEDDRTATRTRRAGCAPSFASSRFSLRRALSILPPPRRLPHPHWLLTVVLPPPPSLPRRSSICSPSHVSCNPHPRTVTKLRAQAMPPPRDLAPNLPPSEIIAFALPPPEIGAATPCPILGSFLSRLTRTTPRPSPRDHRLTPSTAAALARGSGPSGTGPTQGWLSRSQSQWRLWSLDPRGLWCARGPTVPVEAGDDDGCLRGIPAGGKPHHRHRRPPVCCQHRGAGPITGLHPPICHPDKALPLGAMGDRGAQLRRPISSSPARWTRSSCSTC
jgi:hypothetical protein